MQRKPFESPIRKALLAASHAKHAGPHGQSAKAKRRDQKVAIRKGRWDEQSTASGVVLISAGLAIKGVPHVFTLLFAAMPPRLLRRPR